MFVSNTRAEIIFMTPICEKYIFVPQNSFFNLFLRYTMKPLMLVALSRKLFVFAGFLLIAAAANAQSDARIRLALNGGWGYRIAKTNENVPMEARSIVDGLRSGISYGGDFLYYLSDQWGIGAKYNGFNKKVTTGSGASFNGLKEINTSVQFIGATVGTRLANSQTGALHLALSIGYLGYTEKDLIDSQYVKFSPSSVGATWDFGYDLRISEKIAIGAQISLLSGVVTQTINQQTQKENVSRIDLSAGIRFTL